VPFARYVVMNQHLHTFPFKRYQIQPVWRADRPQKGRYREFFQCDADVVGTNSLLCEAEIVLMIKEVFEKLGLADYSIKLNNRKILSGIAELMGAPGKEGPLCVAIDKLDKIGEEKVFEELKERGFGNDAAEKLQPFLQLTGSNTAIIAGLEKLLAGSEVGMQGLAELKEVMIMVEGFGIKVDQLAIDPTLARGLSYYTGCIFEVKPTSVQMGSICGGGRYDDLTGMFGLPNVSGVGISFGIDRIYDVLDELNLFPAESVRTSKVLIANFDEASARKSLAILSKLREAGIAAELYPESAKLKKQFTYAESKGIPYLLMAGESEFASGEFGLKNLQSGEQKTFTIDQIISELR
jgi:histidyl-tRNA synthetase